jgi:hypothetical protein
MSDFKPGDSVLIKATVLRTRAGLVETQVGDGQMLRTAPEHVARPREQPAAKSVAAAENKAVRAAENKAAGKAKSK